jgi:hypothetical protein
MSYKRLLMQLIAPMLATLMLVGCGAPSDVVGTLINQATDRPMKGAQVILCRVSGAKTCVIDINLTALTDSEGEVHIAEVKRGKYIVLYNSSGEKQSKWEGVEIDFTPVQPRGTNLLPVGQGILESLGASSLSVCALQADLEWNSSGQARAVSESGYLYFPDSDLAFILVESEPVSVNVRGETPINLSVWSTRERECNGENFNPVQ